MKQKILLFLFLCLAQVAVAQTSPKDSVFALMAKDICTQIIANESALSKSSNVEMELGLLMLPVYSDYSEQLKKVVPGFDMLDTKKQESLGESIGEKLAFTCPAFLKLITNNRTLMNAALNKPEEQLVKGSLIKIVTGEFTSIHIRTAQGKIEKLWWMEYFDGANLLMEGTNLLNKFVVIAYSEHEVYNAVQKEYVKIKVIKGIED